MKTSVRIEYAFDQKGIVLCIRGPSEFRVTNTLRVEDCDRMTEEEINKLLPASKRNITLEEDQT